MINKQSTGGQKEDILYTRVVKAGKRIYYIDVKKNSRGDMYLALTESKKVPTGDIETPNFNYEKHKIFVYPEDFDKFTESLADVMQFIYKEQGPTPPRPEEERDINIGEIEFWRKR